MAQAGGDGGRVGPDFNLPDKVLSVIPTDPYEQLDLARKITSMAIASRVTNLETEAGSLRQKLDDKDRLVRELHEKVSQLESAYEDAELRLRTAQEDNMKILKERDSFASTVKKLSRDLSKLEAFKRQLMQSLNDENTPQTETVDIGTYDQSVTKAYPKKDDDLNGYNKTDGVSNQSGQKASTNQHITPRCTPTGTPKTITSPSPRGYSAAVSPQRTSGAASPTTQYERRGSLSSWIPSSQQSSATNSPPRGRPPSGSHRGVNESSSSRVLAKILSSSSSSSSSSL